MSDAQPVGRHQLHRTLAHAEEGVLREKGRSFEPEGPEFVAQICGLPNRLSDDQKKLCGDLKLDDNLAKMGDAGQASGVAGQLADQVKKAQGGDAAAQADLEKMVADLSGLDPELQDMSPTVKNRLNRIAERLQLAHKHGDQDQSASSGGGA